MTVWEARDQFCGRHWTGDAQSLRREVHVTFELWKGPGPEAAAFIAGKLPGQDSNLEKQDQNLL